MPPFALGDRVEKIGGRWRTAECVVSTLSCRRLRLAVAASSDDIDDFCEIGRAMALLTSDHGFNT